MNFIDINCDMGELPEHVAGGLQEAILPHITSVNIACGAHAGDESMMRATIQQALRHKIAIGAHPGYADRVHFGRYELRMANSELAHSVCEQITALARVAAECGAAITHVKPHGALYNQAARDPEIARAIADGVARWRTSPDSAGKPPQLEDIVMIGISGSPMVLAFADAGFRVAAEAFADRRYEPDGSLRARKMDDALIALPADAAEQAVRIAERAAVIASNGAEIPIAARTICIHSDTPDAPRIAASVNAALRRAGITPRALASPAPHD